MTIIGIAGASGGAGIAGSCTADRDRPGAADKTRPHVVDATVKRIRSRNRMGDVLHLPYRRWEPPFGLVIILQARSYP